MDIAILGNAIERGEAMEERRMSKGSLKFVAIGDVVLTKDNQRTIDPKDPDLLEMSATMKQHGVIQPMAGRPHPNKKGKIELRAGERRFHAAKIAGLKEVPIFVRELDDQAAQEITAIENLHRKDLTILEQAAEVALLLKKKWPTAEVAAHLGKTEGWVMRRAQISKLDAIWKKEMAKPDSWTALWSAAHYELIARLPAPTQQIAFKDLTDRYGYRGGAETIAIADLEKDLAELTRSLDKAPWDLTDAGLVPKAGACSACLKRSSCCPLLFEEMEQEKTAKGDRCLDDGCWSAKQIAVLKKTIADAKSTHGAKLVISGEIHRRNTGKSVVEWLNENGWQANHHFDSAKKSDRDSFPVLDATTGKVSWKKKFSSGSSSSPKTARPVDPDPGKPKLKTLAQRRKELQDRRDAFVIKHLQEKVLAKQTFAALPVESKSLHIMAALVSVFGTDGREDYGGGRAAVAQWERVEGRSKPSKTAQAETAETLWGKVRPVLELRLRFSSLVHLPACDAEKIAKLIGIDYKMLQAKAADEIPEPKSWAKLGTDGYPKGQAKKKAGKKKAAKKTIKKKTAKKKKKTSTK
jgi:ParB/RepB/Spo0J family partition protein